MFETFGKLESVLIQRVKRTNPDAPDRLLALVFFNDSEKAAKAIEEMHEKEVDGHKLYVAKGLKRQQLDQDIIEFKKDEKRCNLFVKGFPSEINETILTAFFERITQPGAIKKMRIENDWYDSTKANFAFVCLKTPDLVNLVKQ